MFARIAADPNLLGGKPCIKGTRISVEFILELLASGGSQGDILAAYPQLKAGDVHEALLYASRFLRNEVVLSVEVPR